ncbi:hypothetical protein WJX77_010985 [Trebouxia sp. C0004]
MANVQQGFGNSPADAYFSIPPVTRYFATACLALTTLVNFKLISPYLIYLSWSHILKLQVWRLVSPFLFLGGFSFRFLIQLIWLVTYGRTLESSTFQFSTPDFVYMFMFGMGCMLAASLIPFFKFPFLASPLIFMLIYVWSRNFPTASVSIMGLVSVEAFYVPFAFLGISLISGNDWLSDVLGILAGHLYYTLKVLLPAQGRQSLLETPQFVKNLVFASGIGTVNPREINPTNPGQAGFRAFRGRGQRLAG